MLKRYRVFEPGEKKNLVSILVKIHFEDFDKKELPLKNFPIIYSSPKGQKIKLDYENDNLRYCGEMDEKKILRFKNAYESIMAKNLHVWKED